MEDEKNHRTCIACRIQFRDDDLHRMHHKSSWHTYNLKRKKIQLPPISEDSFKSKVEIEKNKNAKKLEESSIVGFTCTICIKFFRSRGAYTSHVVSKKHKVMEKKQLAVVRERVINEEVDAEKEEDSDSVMSNGESMTQMLARQERVEKALNDAKSSMSNPEITKGDREAYKKQKQQRREQMEKEFFLEHEGLGLKKVEEESEVEPEPMEDEEWEDCSSDDDVWDEEDDQDQIVAEEAKKITIEEAEVKSETSESSTSSDICGILSRFKYDSDADVASIGSSSNKEFYREICLKECLFCPRMFANTNDKVFHMSKAHSFFIPELAFVVDLENLLLWLGKKIGILHECLFCTKKGFPSLSAIRGHMCDKGHCKISVEKDDWLDIADFYDFQTTFPDEQGGELMEFEEGGESQLIDYDEGLVPRSTVDKFDDEDNMELVLPSGARIGHRKLMKYYKQSYPTVDRGFASGKSTVAKLMSQYSMVGWGAVGSSSKTVQKFRRDITHVQRMKKKHDQIMGRNNNKTMMKHFRRQILM